MCRCNGEYSALFDVFLTLVIEDKGRRTYTDAWMNSVPGVGIFRKTYQIDRGLMPNPYHAFLLRIWLIKEKTTTAWRITLEDTQTRKLTGFHNLEDFLEYIQNLCEADEEPGTTNPLDSIQRSNSTD